MKQRTWPVLLVGLGLLLLLITTAGLAFTAKARDVYRSVTEISEQSREYGRVLEDLKATIFGTALATRDLILDPRSDDHVEQLHRLKKAMRSHVQELTSMTTASDQHRVNTLAAEVEEYWRLVEPMLEWTPEQRLREGPYYLRQVLRGRRTSLVSTIGTVSALNRENLIRETTLGRDMTHQLDNYLRSALIVTVILGLVIVAGSAYRVTKLERRADEHRQQAEAAEHAMRDLSHKLVHAQEEERKRISRELHDEVGQLLTALRIELGNLQQKTRSGESGEPLADTKSLAERSLRAVRDIAMGLRPSMLDDLGLGPAVEWQAREFSRRLGIPVKVECTGELEPLSDAHRTCIYRVVQEALTNCARHARARQVEIRIENVSGWLRVQVIDDGVGMSADRVRAGLGLLGMKERVRELDGTMHIDSTPRKGTTVRVDVPLRSEVRV